MIGLVLAASDLGLLDLLAIGQVQVHFHLLLSILGRHHKKSPKSAQVCSMAGIAGASGWLEAYLCPYLLSAGCSSSRAIGQGHYTPGPFAKLL